MNLGNLVICGLLIFLRLAGLCGLFLAREYVKKIISLSISYSSFLILITLISLKSSKLSEVLLIMVSVLIVFSMNLFIGTNITKNISQSDEPK
jgi:hypothetical protein